MKTFLLYRYSILAIFLFVISDNLLAQSPSSDENYIIEHTVREKNITDKSQLAGKTVSQVNRSIQYVDGLGRPKQSIVFSGSPGGKDIVQHIEYDDFGREQYKYLPYVANVSSGAFIVTAAADQDNFYDINTPPSEAANVVKDTDPFSRTIFEASPINRVLKQGAPGAAWQPDEVIATDDKSVVFEYTTNIASEVFLWTIKDDQCILDDGHYYDPNELYVTVTKDEHWVSGNNGTVREYTDKQGRVVLKRTYENSAAHDTYYVYDDFGNLRVVLPPEGINQIGTALVGIATDNIKTSDTPVTSTTGIYYYCPGVTITLPDGGNYQPGFEVKPYPLNVDLVDQYLFIYKYDDRQRMIEKKVPGADPVYMVYDNRDRLVLTQDGDQRLSSEWLFTKYDQLNRPVLAGTFTKSGDQATVQAAVDAHYVITTNLMYEDRSGDWTGADHGYTDQSYPVGIGTDNYLTVSYYDDYGFETGTTYDYPTSPSAPYNGNVKLDAPKGQVTGGKIRKLGSTDWYSNVVYYDKKYRNIYGISSNHKGGYDKNYGFYDFVGNAENAQYVHTATGQSTLTIDKTFNYDHMSRLLSVDYAVNGTNNATLLTNEYNELGELVTKYLHGDDINHSQAVDYAYNIRGWLTDINDPANVSTADGSDYFGMQLRYNNPADVSDLQSEAQYNGNISEIQWQNAQTQTLSAYGFKYDDLNRLNTAHYGETSTYAVNSGHWDENMSYDFNGNIETLLRKASGSTVDDLDYDYTGNRLNQVDDANSYSGEENHFVDGNTGADYGYDANGNMISDANKGIQSISYNHLNLPALIDFGGGNTITYIYDAAGIKLSKVVTESGQADKTTDYIGGIVYEDDVQKFISTEEGRIMLEDGTPEYQYHLTDHLGNVRLTYTTASDADLTSTYMATMETAARTLEEATFDNISSTAYTDAVFNKTAGGSISARMNGMDANRTMGPAMSLHVMPGDDITMDVWAKYTQAASSTSDAITTMASILANSTAGGSVAEVTQIDNGLSTLGLAQGSTQWDTDKTVPRAYINYLFFDRNQQYKSGGFDQVSSSANGNFEQLSLSYTPTEEGYMLIYLANQTNESLEVYMDDMTITHEEGPIVRTDDYYPFGLTFNSSERSGHTTNNFLYNGKELQTDLNLGWYDYGARMYDASIGRWHVEDPMADKYTSISPYDYVGGNPVNRIDPDGMDWYQETDDNGDVVDEGGVIWQEGSDAREGYSNIGADYTQDLGDGVTITFNQNVASEMTETVLSEGDWETQRTPTTNSQGVVTGSENKAGEEGNCFYQAGVMVSNSGATSLGGEANNTTGTNDIVNYIASEANQGNSSRIHVDYNNNGTGDHWVAISSVTTNLRTGNVASMNFYDPGTWRQAAGTHNTNTLTVVTGTLTGTTNYSGSTYNTTAVRRNAQ